MTREKSATKALHDFLDYHGHPRISVKNVSPNKRTSRQIYEVVLLGYVPHDNIRSDFNDTFSENNSENVYIKIDDIRPVESNTGMSFIDDHYSGHTMFRTSIKYCGSHRPYFI